MSAHLARVGRQARWPRGIFGNSACSAGSRNLRKQMLERFDVFPWRDRAAHDGPASSRSVDSLRQTELRRFGRICGASTRNSDREQGGMTSFHGYRQELHRVSCRLGGRLGSRNRSCSIQSRRVRASHHAQAAAFLAVHESLLAAHEHGPPPSRPPIRGAGRHCTRLLGVGSLKTRRFPRRNPPNWKSCMPSFRSRARSACSSAIARHTARRGSTPRWRSAAAMACYGDCRVRSLHGLRGRQGIGCARREAECPRPFANP